MYLFARTATAKPGRALDAATFATEVAGQVSSITGVEVHAWSTLYGAPITQLSWTALIDSHAAMGEVSEKLQADPGFQERIGVAGELFEAAPEDVFAEVVATVNDSGKLGTYANLVQAQVAGGKIGDAMAFAVDMLNHVGKVTGRDGLLTRSLYGPWASMGWIMLAHSLEEIDAAGEAMAADADYISKIDKAGDLFLPGSGHVQLSQRIH